MCGSCDNDDSIWITRERDRFLSNEYSKPIWFDDDDFVDVLGAFIRPDTDNHFVHVSLNNPSMLAYTENSAKGHADRQTPIKVGRYLNRFTKGLTEDRIREVVEAHNACFDTGALEIATTSDDIVQVYTNGPSSCMSYSPSHFSSSQHPTVVYGSGDLGIAYIGGLAKPRGRALVYLKKKVYSTIYGDVARLKSILDKSGYKPDKGSDFEGAKVKLVRCENNIDGYIMPYLDNEYGVKYSSDRDHFVMTHSYDYCAQYTHGLHEECGWWCAWCEESQCEGDDHVYVDGTGDICWHCYENYFMTCEECSEVIHQDNMREVIRFFTRTITTTEQDPKTKRYLTRTERGTESLWVCDCCTDNHYYCESCDQWFEEGTYSEEDEMCRCEDCNSEHEKEVEADKHNEQLQLQLEQEQNNNAT